jgi:biopolymer transport protein TolQ
MTSSHLNDTGLLNLISQAGMIAKFVLLILSGASIMTWAIIVAKWKRLKSATIQNKQFMNVFWNSKTLDEAVNKCHRVPHSPIAAIFQYGVKELKKQGGETSSSAASQDRGSDRSDPIGRGNRIEGLHRALMRASQTEISALEKHVSWLATTASAAPFVGLFGTVWGIMNAFQSIGATGAANLAVVAPGISEALITTAAGIAAAIPAVIAYNYFAGQIKQVAVDMECFSQDFINLMQRNLSNTRKGN